MSYEFYKILHIFSLIVLITSALLIDSFVYNSFQTYNLKSLKRCLYSFHGIGALISLVSGFGLIARIGQSLEIQSSYSKGLITLFVLCLAFTVIYNIKKKNLGNPLIGKLISKGVYILGFLMPSFLFQNWVGYKLSVWLFLVFYPLLLKIQFLGVTNLKQFSTLNTIFRYSVVLLMSFISIYVVLFFR